MEHRSEESRYWEAESIAMNYPGKFLARRLGVELRDSLPEVANALLEGIASLNSGQMERLAEGMPLLEKLAAKSANPFWKVKYHLLRKRWLEIRGGSTDEIDQAMQSAVDLCKHSPGKALEAEVISTGALHKATEREFTGNEEMIQQAINLALQTGNAELILGSYINYANLCQIHQFPNLANREFHLLFEYPDLDKHPFRHAQLLIHFSENQAVTGNFGDAVSSLETALGIADQYGYAILEVIALTNLGITAKRMKDLDKSLECYDKCLALLGERNAGGSILASKVRQNKASTLSLAGRLEEARDILYEALEYAVRTSNPLQTNIIRVNLADILIEVEEFVQALDLLDKAIEYFQEAKNYNFLQNAHLCKARCYQEQEDYASAFESMEYVYEASKMHFRENYNNQTRKYQDRIGILREQYMMIKSTCRSLENNPGDGRPSELIGEHPLLKKAINDAIMASKHPFANVIIYGESGTGKELLARMIHSSAEQDRALVAINTSAVPTNLIESELFGHVKGAFTGAVSDRKGKFQLANNGTLFLDEISEMPLDLQAKLLRAIEYQTITPVGSDKEIKVKCRIICATNKDLRSMIKQNLFRLDLYHRLNKVEIDLPPLRERLSDLEILTDFFVKRFSKDYAYPLPTIREDFFLRLRQHSFPGNIRELANLIERLFILKPSTFWDASLLDGIVLTGATKLTCTEPGVSKQIKDMEHQIILDALEQSNWVQKEAAKLLDMTESTLSRRITRYKIVRPQIL